MQARFSKIKLQVEGADVSELIAPYVESVKYSDSLENEADSVSITLNDSQRKFLQGMLPLRGSECQIGISKRNWNTKIFTETAPEEILNLGCFYLDTIENQFPPTTCTLKFISVPNSATIRGVNKDKAWEQVNLSKIARDIASSAGLTLFYDTGEDPEIKRAEQSGESDLSFLQQLCRNNGLNLKVANKKLIIFEALKYESKPPVRTLKYSDPIILKFDGSATINQIYGDAQVDFKSNGISEWLFGLFGGLDLIKSVTGLNLDLALPNGAGGNVLKINEKVNSEKEARKLAKSRLREKNKNEWKITLNLMGSFDFLSGNVIKLEEFGMYSGMWLIERADHSFGNGYVTNVQLHKCLRY